MRELREDWEEGRYEDDSYLVNIMSFFGIRNDGQGFNKIFFVSGVGLAACAAAAATAMAVRRKGR